jgi:hypothetical protein
LRAGFSKSCFCARDFLNTAFAHGFFLKSCFSKSC